MLDNNSDFYFLNIYGHIALKNAFIYFNNPFALPDLVPILRFLINYGFNINFVYSIHKENILHYAAISNLDVKYLKNWFKYLLDPNYNFHSSFIKYENKVGLTQVNIAIYINSEKASPAKLYVLMNIFLNLGGNAIIIYIENCLSPLM